jgi:hypothetical protein
VPVHGFCTAYLFGPPFELVAVQAAAGILCQGLDNYRREGLENSAFFSNHFLGLSLLLPLLFTGSPAVFFGGPVRRCRWHGQSSLCGLNGGDAIHLGSGAGNDIVERFV